MRARHAELVLNQWGMGNGSRRRGIVSLFAGPPGTGKTMAAEVIGDALGLDLYVINLATVIDKYIGETEKNLERVFEAATGVNGILFFDEADALFGKRSEVKDARDRYANVETAYLLQRLERFEGTAILATNLKANLDEAFSRRIDVFVDFPLPEAGERERIWRSALTESLPVGDDIDIEFLATAFEFGGGNIVNVVVTAAFMAAERGAPGRHAGPHPGNRTRVPQARPALHQGRVRSAPAPGGDGMSPQAARPGCRATSTRSSRSSTSTSCEQAEQGVGDLVGLQSEFGNEAVSTLVEEGGGVRERARPGT